MNTHAKDAARTQDVIMQMSGTLGEAFQLTGRGVVVILNPTDDGRVRGGDILVVGERRWKIGSIEFADRKENDEMVGHIAAILPEAELSDITSLGGQSFTTVGAAR